MKRFSTLSLVFFITIFKSYSGNHDPIAFWVKSNSSDLKMLSSSLFTASGNIADGNRVVFDLQYSNAVDGNDAIKIMNPGENFGLTRDNRTLAIEARQPVAAGDTLFYTLVNLIPQVYKLEIAAQNLGSTTANCELIDRYLNTRKSISLTDSNHLIFEVTADPASRASNRLLIVFNNPVSPLLPVAFTNISATSVERKIELQWQVVHEMTVQQYQVERSTDAIHFNSISSVAPIYENENGGVYSYNDVITDPAPQYFYRVRSTDKNGISRYSSQVKISVSVMKTEMMSVYPNPVTNNSFQLELNKMLPGKYYITISNNLGQQVYSVPVNVSGNYFKQVIELNANTGKAVYYLTVKSGNTIVKSQKIIVF